MQIPSVIRKCVCFIGRRTSDGRELLCGTGFFVAKSLDEHIAMVYCVTAAHVLEKIHAQGGDTVLVRMNLRNEPAKWIEHPLKRCTLHPDHAVDVGIVPMGVSLYDVDHIAW